MKILIALTSNDRMGGTGRPTGLWLEELAAPYLRFRAAGATVTLASPAGGRPPVDPVSELADAQTDETRRFSADAEAQAAREATRPLAEVSADAHDALFLPGGHGPLWDLAEDPACRRLVEAFLRLGKPVAALCHGPAALLRAQGPDDAPVLRGRRVTGFSDREEAAVGLDQVVPLSIERECRALGAHYEAAPPFESLVVADGLLITGQNPASSVETADRLLDKLRTAPTATARKAAESYPS